MGLIGNGEGHTLVILTDAESRSFRLLLSELDEAGAPQVALLTKMLNAGIARGTAKLQQEAKDAAKAKREGK